VGFRAGLDPVEERKMSCLCQETNPGCPARSYTDRAIQEFWDITHYSVLHGLISQKIKLFVLLSGFKKKLNTILKLQDPNLNSI
jgi:hypothetical protein